MLCVGLDVSVTNTGYCIGDSTDDPRFPTQLTGVIQSKEPCHKVYPRMRRYAQIVVAILDKIEERGIPSLVLIEGYAFSKQFKQVALAELGCMLRWNLMDLMGEGSDDRILEPANATLKKFTTGVGKGDKTAIVGAIGSRWSRSFKTSHEAEAFGLWTLARCCIDPRLCEHAYQLEAVGTVKGMEPSEVEELKQSHKIRLLNRGAQLPFVGEATNVGTQDC